MPFLPVVLLMLADGPSAQALADARTVAETGMLATIARVQTQAETEELVSSTADLTDAEKAQLRAIGSQVSTMLIAQAVAAEAAAYAANMAEGDLAAIAAFARSDAAAAQRTAMPAVMMTTMQAISAGGPIDFKGETRKRFCADTGKLCEGK